MANIQAYSKEELKEVNSLLDKDIPSRKQAYNFRIAWIMACLSELAYIKFNPLFSPKKQKDYFISNIKKLVKENQLSSLIKLIEKVGYDESKEKGKLIKKLGTLRFKLIETFDEEGTQAILVSNDKFIALAFRGTEPTSIKDIKTDAKATHTQYETGGRIHEGFYDAFLQVAKKIQKKIDDEKFQKLPLFITGHSLGGALATIAAKKLTHQGGVAACYTFGSPRVGDQEWVSNIKTPIYRLVNAADFVTMLPPGDELITIVSWISNFIPWLGEPLNKFLTAKLGGYLHAGNMRYLTNCRRKGQYNNVMLLFSVSLFYRIKGLMYKKLPLKKLLADHSIEIYRKKLKIIAQK